MKKLIPLILVAIMLFTTGCSQKDSGKVEGSSNTTSDEPSSQTTSSSDISSEEPSSEIENSSDISSEKPLSKTPSVADTSTKATSSKAPPSSSKTTSSKTVSSTPPVSSTSVEPLHYKDEEIKSFYAVDVDNYLMAKMEGESYKEILSDLDAYVSDEAVPEGLGFLIFTDTKREYIYLDSSNQKLIEVCKESLENSPLHPSWLIHMTSTKIVNAKYTGSDYNSINDKQKLIALSNYLKNELTVAAKTRSHVGPNNPTLDGFLLSIEFDTGINYTLINYYNEAEKISVHSSDLDTTIHYALDKDFYAKFNKFILSL